MIENFKKELETLLRNFEEKLDKFRSHKLSLSFLENINLEIYNQKLSLRSLGFFSQLDPLTFRFDVYDINIISEIEKALLERKESFTLSREKNSLFIKFPPLTEELKKEMLKSLNSLKEDFRIKSRLLRDNFLKNLKTNKEIGKISEDNFYKIKEEVDKEIEKFNQKVDRLFIQKEKEILS